MTTIADLKPDPKNARRHNSRNIGMIVDSLQKVGAARSIVIDQDNVILAGNGVIEAAAEAGIERVRIIEADGNEIIAVRRSGLTDEQKLKLSVFDNRTSELAEWNTDVLADLNLDLGEFFFDSELKDLGIVEEKTEDPGPQIDRAAELQEKWGTCRGQVWTIGSHRLMCGDSTSAEDVGRLMGGKKADLLLSDPPYNASEYGRDYGVRSTDVAEWDKGFDICAWWVGCSSSLTPKHTAYVFGHHRTLAPLWIAWERDADSTGFLCWEKPAPPPNLRRLNWTWAIELIAFRQMKGRTFTLPPDGRNLLRCNAPRGNGRIHPTQKPVEILCVLIEASSEKAHIVFDPFLGSGTTMVAAEQLGRICYGMEISEAYTAVCLERMSGMGLEPVLTEL